MNESGTAGERAAWGRRLVKSIGSGILATMSRELPGYPFGSVTPYVVTHTGDLVLYVSGLAQHTKNMMEDPRVCLTVAEEGTGNQQALARVSVLGDAGPAGRDEALAARYFSLVPGSEAYAEMHDFELVRIAPKRVRYIGGFGKIFWIEPEDWTLPTPDWAGEGGAIVDHMNDDHADALVAIVRHCSGRETDAAEMLAVDPDGFHVRADDQLHYVAFEAPCLTADAVRKAMVAATRAAR